jgi:hypothetical protein
VEESTNIMALVTEPFYGLSLLLLLLLLLMISHMTA